MFDTLQQVLNKPFAGQTELEAWVAEQKFDEAIAKRILASHHGDIDLRATGPEGTTMSILLPLA